METTKGARWLLAAALVVGWPLLLPWTYDTHDGHYALYNAAQLDHALRDGSFPVRWLPDLFGGRGIPLFLYYHPLASYLVALVHLAGLGFIASMKVVELGTVVLSGFSMRAFLREHAGEDAAWVGAVAYVAAPIQVVELHVKGDPPALLAYALAPLVFLGIARAARGSPYGVPALALACAGLGLAHSVTALLLVPAAALYAALALPRGEAGAAALRVGAGCLLGGAIASFHVVPAITERALVHIDSPLGILAFDWRDHFVAAWQWLSPLWGYHGSFAGTRDDMSFQVGPAHVAGILLGVWALRRAEGARRRLPAWAAAVTGLALLATLSASRPVWELVGALRYVQFPWRFLMPASLGASALVAVAIEAWPARTMVLACATAPPLITGAFAVATGNRFYAIVLAFQLLLGAGAWLLRGRASSALALVFAGLALPWSAVPLHARFKHEPAVVPIREADLAPERVRLGTRRTTARDDYLPRTVGEGTIPPRDLAQEYLPPAGAVPPEDVAVRAGSVEVGTATRDGRGIRFSASAPEGGIVALEIHDFPGWRVRIAGGDPPREEELVPGRDEAGRIVVSIPPGRWEVRCVWTETPWRRLWDGVSLAGLVAVGGLTLRARRGRR